MQTVVENLKQSRKKELLRETRERNPRGGALAEVRERLPRAGAADLLRAELAERCRKNPAYSLRAFAKGLGFSPAFVSKLLNGQRRFTPATLARIGERLALDPAAMARFRAASAASAKTGLPEAAPESYRALPQDQFQLIADWHHFAILELTTVAGFEPQPRWVAKKLGLNVHQASDALERLERLGFLARDARGALRLVSEHNTNAGPDTVAAAARAQQKQFLELALAAVDDVPNEFRSQSGMTMAIPSKRIDEAVAAIVDFRRKLTALLQRPGERDSVYQLSISFFPLTK